MTLFGENMRSSCFFTFAAIFTVISAFAADESKQPFSVERDLIVFVGRRVSVMPDDDPRPSMDFRRRARYEVLQLLHGSYEAKTIDFTVFDHEGRFEFSKFETTLLFVSRHEGKLYHEKYQFFEVYPTKDGRWAACGDPYKYESEVNKRYDPKPLRPVVIEFATPLPRGASGSPCTEGNYVEDIFELKKRGVLRNRGLFKSSR